jgi:phage shock protein A
MAEGGLWTRVVRLVRSRTASDDGPDLEEVRERLDDAYRTQSRLLSQVRRGVADVATSRKRVEIQLASLRREIETAGTEASAAVERGDDGGARRALERQLALEKAATELDNRHTQLRSEEEQLNNSAAGIERQIEDFRIRKDTLSARYSAAQARNEIHGATSGIGATAGEVGHVMADAERHTRELEATADAVDELMNEGILARPGESQDEALLRRFDEALGSVDEPRGVEGDGHGPHQISK